MARLFHPIVAPNNIDKSVEKITGEYGGEIK